MEFGFDVREVLPDAITRVTSDHLPQSQRKGERSQQLAAIINKLGAASAKAQGLRAAVTTYQKLMASSHTLYLLRDKEDMAVVVGLLKVGRKKLFLRDLQGVQRERETLCVLDFYVHESRQRAGHGRRLFQTMLNREGVRAAELAIDRPSSKFLSFLRKHYHLHSNIKQGNNFVVFNQFFQNGNSITPELSSNLSDVAKDTRMEGEELKITDLQPTSVRPTVVTTPKQTELPLQHQILSPCARPAQEGTANFNWSPQSVLLRSWQRLRHAPRDIITGIPLPTREVAMGYRGEKKAPLLTMRERERCLKGGSRLGFGGPFSQLSATGTPLGFHLVGGANNRNSAYSRHNLNPMHPCSRTHIHPDQKPPDSGSKLENSRM